MGMNIQTANYNRLAFDWFKVVGGGNFDSSVQCSSIRIQSLFVIIDTEKQIVWGDLIKSNNLFIGLKFQP